MRHLEWNLVFLTLLILFEKCHLRVNLLQTLNLNVAPLFLRETIILTVHIA